MLTNTWRRLTSPAAWAFAIVLGSPMLAEAQQGGLFPLAPSHRRPRVPCPMEDPVYGLYRQEYFGYHPTCWRRFPAGWGCPTPEAPNVEQAFRDRPHDPPPLSAPGGPGGPEGMEPEIPGAGAPAPGPGEEKLPALPAEPGRSPFRLDPNPTPDNTKPAPNAPPADRPPANSSPLDLPPGPAEAPNPGAATGGGTGNDLPSPTGLLDVPGQPAAEGGPLLALPEPSSAAATAVPARPSAPPSLLPPAANQPNLPPGAPPLPTAPPGVNQGNPLVRPGPAAYAPPSAPVQAPRRMSLLGLLGSPNRSRR